MVIQSARSCQGFRRCSLWLISQIVESGVQISRPRSIGGGAMTRLDLLVRIAICGAVAGCSGSPAAPCGSCVGLFAPGRVNMTFTPQEHGFEEAAEAYRRVWVDEG